MNAPLALAELASMQAAAAVSGQSVKDRCLARCYAALDSAAEKRGARPFSAAAWRGMSVHLRAHLLAECTERREPHRDALLDWRDFSADERIAIGALAREWRRQLEAAAGCLR